MWWGARVLHCCLFNYQPADDHDAAAADYDDDDDDDDDDQSPSMTINYHQLWWCSCYYYCSCYCSCYCSSSSSCCCWWWWWWCWYHLLHRTILHINPEPETITDIGHLTSFTIGMTGNRYFSFQGIKSSWYINNKLHKWVSRLVGLARGVWT